MLNVIGIGVPFKLRAGAWSPSALFASSEVGVWYDPSDLTTMFQNSNGTTAVAVGDPVGYIADKSGNGKHATQSTAAARPILREADGLYYLEFDGTDDFMVTPSIDFTGTDKMSLFAGHKYRAIGYSAILEHGGSSYTDEGVFTLWEAFSNSEKARVSVGHGAAATSTLFDVATVDLEKLVISASLDYSITNVTGYKFRKNGAAIPRAYDGTPPASAGMFNTGAMYIGARSLGTASFFYGNLYGLVVRGVVSSAAEIARTEAYIAEKAGVTGLFQVAPSPIWLDTGV